MQLSLRSQQQKNTEFMNRIFTFLLLQSVCLGALLAQPNRRTQDESTLPANVVSSMSAMPRTHAFYPATV